MLTVGNAPYTIGNGPYGVLGTASATVRASDVGDPDLNPTIPTHHRGIGGDGLYFSPQDRSDRPEFNSNR